MANNNSSHRSNASQPSRYNSSSGQRRPTYSERYNRPNPYTGYLPPGVANKSSDIYHPEGIDPVRAHQLQREQLYKSQLEEAEARQQAERQAREAARAAQPASRPASAPSGKAQQRPAPAQQSDAVSQGVQTPPAEQPVTHVQRRTAPADSSTNPPARSASHGESADARPNASRNRQHTSKRRAVAAAQAAARANQTRPDDRLKQIEKAAAAETATDVLLETMRKATAEAMQFREEFRRAPEVPAAPAAPAEPAAPVGAADASSASKPKERPRIEFADEDELPSALVLSRRKSRKNGPSLRWSAPKVTSAAPAVEAAELITAGAAVHAAVDAVDAVETEVKDAGAVTPVVVPDIHIEEEKTSAPSPADEVQETENTAYEEETAEAVDIEEAEAAEEPAQEVEEIYGESETDELVLEEEEDSAQASEEPQAGETEEDDFEDLAEEPAQEQDEAEDLYEGPDDMTEVYDDWYSAVYAEKETAQVETDDDAQDWEIEDAASQDSDDEPEQFYIPEDDDFDDDIVFEDDDEIFEEPEQPEEEALEDITPEPEDEEPLDVEAPEEEEEEEEDDVLIYSSGSERRVPEEMTEEDETPEEEPEDAGFEEAEDNDAEDEADGTDNEPETEEPEEETGDAAAEAPADDEPEIRVSMPVITPPANSNRRNFETRISAELAVPDYHPGVAQDETLFIRKKRPEAATAVFSATTPGLAPDVDDDDFFEQWLEEGDDMIIKDKRQRRRVSAVIGAVTMIFALIGFSFIVFKLVEGLPKKNTTSTRTNYASYILPVVNADPEPFETISASDNNVLVEAAINRLTYGEAASEHSYTAVDVEGETRLLIPLADVEESGKALFGDSFSVSVSEMYTIDDEEMFYYSAADGFFHVVMAGSDMEPDVIKVSRIGSGSQITLDVGYISDGAEIEDEDDYYKLLQYILDTTDDGYYISAIREMSE